MSQPSSISRNLQRLRSASARLNDRTTRVHEIIASLEAALGTIDLDFKYVHPHPVDERAFNGPAGKRVIELQFLCYASVGGKFRLGIKSLKVLESKQSMATERPGQVRVLADAPTHLMHRAIDLLAPLIEGLTAEVERAADDLSRRCDRIEWLTNDIKGVISPPVVTERPAESRSVRGNLHEGPPSDRGVHGPRKTRPRRNTPPRVIINRAPARRPTPAP